MSLDFGQVINRTSSRGGDLAIDFFGNVWYNGRIGVFCLPEI